MTSVDWEEVKKLAADFQRAQLSSTAQTLSERNCIEIINKLIELSLLDVIFTADGKEFITPQYLIKEIKDELYVSGGRINLTNLSKALNIDLTHIFAKAEEIVKSAPGCQILNGQLIDRNYATTIAEEINEKLKTNGKVHISELTKQYDLPSDFLQSVLEKNLGKIVEAKQDKVDSGLFFTEAFVERNKCVVRGALAALTQPTSVATILSAVELAEREFYAAYEWLSESKQIVGALTGKQGTNTTYIPYVYTKQQSEWVDNFYKQNGYLEYDALLRLGISDATSFVRRHFPNAGIVELNTVAIGPQLLSQVNDSIEETLISGSYLDLKMILPSVFIPADVSKVLNISLKKLKSKAVVHMFCDTIIVTEKFLQDVMQPLHDTIVKKKAIEVVKSGDYLQSLIEKNMSRGGGDLEDSKVDKKEERRKKAAGGKLGGGTQGRETKTKSTKKKYTTTKRIEESDEEGEEKKTAGQLESLDMDEVENAVAANPALADEDDSQLAAAIASHILPLLNKAFLVEAEEEYRRTLANTAGDKRRKHTALQEIVDSASIEARLAERGLRSLGPSPSDIQTKLTSHLLRSICTDTVNTICAYLADLEVPLSTEARNKIINETSGDAKEPLQKLNKALNSSSVEEFLNCLEAVLPHVDLISRKIDKKKEKSFLLERREKLLAEVAQSDDPATVLHLTALILLQYLTNAIILALPRHIPSLLSSLKSFVSSEDYALLTSFQDQVLKLITSEDEEVKNQMKSELNEHIAEIRNLGIKYKKQVIEK